MVPQNVKLVKYRYSVHKVCVHFKQFITLFVSAIKMICKKELERRKSRFFKVLMSSIVSNAKGDTILQFTKNIFQLIYSNTKITLIILTLKSCNELSLVAHTIVFTCLNKKNLMK